MNSEQKYYQERRRAVLSQMREDEMLLLYSGVRIPCSMDETYPFECNRHFYYLTGLRRENMGLLLSKTGGKVREILYIERPVPRMERWTGKRMRKEEAKEISGIEDVQFIQGMDAVIERICSREFPAALYMECYREEIGAPESYNMQQANRMRQAYPNLPIRNLHPMIARMRMCKDDLEIRHMDCATALTAKGLEGVLSALRPGMMEYQVQARFEYEIRMHGAEAVSFPTIVGSGANACSLHYETNDARIEPGSLVLLDLGARDHGYCADISRTYPADGRFTERQRQLYDLVLEANRAVAALAAPGQTVETLNNRCKEVLSEGLLRMGMIEKADEVGRYFMHGVSHFIGLDTHDVFDRLNRPLEPGMIISDEPGLYIDAENIGIRIEDDLLITENGCRVISEDIPRTAEEIEAIMAGREYQ